LSMSGSLVALSISAGPCPELVALGCPVSRSIVGPRSCSTRAGSTRAAPPTGMTAPGHTRTTLVLGDISLIMPTAVAPMPSSRTTTSGRWVAMRRASSAVVDASATTSYPSPSTTKRRRPFRSDGPSPTTMRTPRALMRSLSSVRPPSVRERTAWSHEDPPAMRRKTDWPERASSFAEPCRSCL
jgi:hypothetical protein